MTTLIACSHGTRSPEGQATVSALVAHVRDLLPDVPVAETFVDVQQPDVAHVVAATDGAAVLVPLLLSRGFHTKVDIADAVAARDDVVATRPLGPHPLLAEVLLDRLVESIGPVSGLGAGDRVVLAGSGSSDPVATEDIGAVAELLRAALPVPVSVGYAAGSDPRIAAAVAAARDAGASRVIALSYVLAPGFFADVVARSGADVVTAPLGADPRIARIVAERFEAAVAETAAS